MKKLIKNFMGTIVGVPLIGATASQVNALPAGTAKNIAGIVPGLQATALVMHATKPIKKIKFIRRKKK